MSNEQLERLRQISREVETSDPDVAIVLSTLTGIISTRNAEALRELARAALEELKTLMGGEQ